MGIINVFIIVLPTGELPGCRRRYCHGLARDLIRTYLERELLQLGSRVPAIRMRRLWTMLAHLQGEPVNYSKLGANLEIDGKTVKSQSDCKLMVNAFK
jgi:predicted AAA+ superfamily ATPase